MTPETGRPETYGLAGWMDHSAFTLSVSRTLEVSLADPQPRYSIGGAGWQGLETVDLLWAGADAFGAPSAGGLAGSFPLAGTVRWSGGLIGAAVRHDGLPPVYGDADLSIRLDSLAGKASFTSLRTSYEGKRYVFGDGSLHYPIAVTNGAIAHRSPGVWLVADFYGPGHAEVAGTLDDSRAGLVASFGATRDERPSRPDVIAGADHVRGMTKQSGFGDAPNGWRRFRCGDGSGCEGRFEWWKPGSAWYAVAASGGRSPRERVLDRTAGWGDWLSEDIFADRGGVRIARRHARATDGGRGRYQADGYYGTMEHAAFGVGFAGFRDWAADGGTSNGSVLGAGFQGSLTGARPPGGAVWNGRMVGFQEGIEGRQGPVRSGPRQRGGVVPARSARHPVLRHRQHGPRAPGGEFRLREHPARLRRQLRRLRRRPGGGRVLRSGARGSRGHVPQERQPDDRGFRSHARGRPRSVGGVACGGTIAGPAAGAGRNRWGAAPLEPA